MTCADSDNWLSTTPRSWGQSTTLTWNDRTGMARMSSKPSHACPCGLVAQCALYLSRLPVGLEFGVRPDNLVQDYSCAVHVLRLICWKSGPRCGRHVSLLTSVQPELYFQSRSTHRRRNHLWSSLTRLVIFLPTICCHITILFSSGFIVTRASMICFVDVSIWMRTYFFDWVIDNMIIYKWNNNAGISVGINYFRLYKSLK